MRSIKFLIKLIPTFLASGLCLAVILWLTLAPDPVGETHVSLFPGADKVVHACMFGGLTLCFCLDYVKWKKQPTEDPTATFFLCGLIAACIGIGIEFLQEAMSLGRSFELWDMVSDTAGALIAFLIVAQYWRNTHRG